MGMGMDWWRSNEWEALFRLAWPIVRFRIAIGGFSSLFWVALVEGIHAWMEGHSERSEHRIPTPLPFFDFYFFGAIYYDGYYGTWHNTAFRCVARSRWQIE